MIRLRAGRALLILWGVLACGDAAPALAPSDVHDLFLKPSPDTIELGDSARLSASALDRTGNPVPMQPQYSTSNSAVATVAATGFVKAVAVGEATISATVGDLQATATVVVPVPVASVRLSLDSVALTKGDTVPLTVTILDAGGSAIARQAIFSTTDPTIAVLNTDRVIRAVGGGLATVRATAGHAIASVAVRVAGSPTGDFVASLALKKPASARAVGVTNDGHIFAAGADSVSLAAFTPYPFALGTATVVSYTASCGTVYSMLPIDTNMAIGNSCGRLALLSPHGQLIASQTIAGAVFGLGLDSDGVLWGALANGWVVRFNATTLQKSDSVNFGGETDAVAFFGDTAYVATADGVWKVNRLTLSKYTHFLGGSGSCSVVVVGKTLFVALQYGDVEMFDVATGQKTGAVDAGLPLGVQLATTYGLAATPDGRFVWVAMPSLGQIAIIDAKTRQVARTVKTGSQFRALAFSYLGAFAFVSDFQLGKLFVYR